MKSKIEVFVSQYYKLLDNYTSVDELLSFFDNEFSIIEGDLLIDSIEKYKAWYNKVNNLFLKRLHTFKSIEISKTEIGYEVIIDMYFEGLKKSNENIIVEATINWNLVQIDNSFKIKKYEINIKG